MGLYCDLGRQKGIDLGWWLPDGEELVLCLMSKGFCDTPCYHTSVQLWTARNTMQRRDIDSLCLPHPPTQGFALTNRSSHHAALAHARPCLWGGWRMCILLDLDLLVLALDPA